MIKLKQTQAIALAAELPAATLDFLIMTGVPTTLNLRGIDCVFNLDMEPMAAGEVFRLGMLDDDADALVVRRSSGHFGTLTLFRPDHPPMGSVPIAPGGPPWGFINTSVAQFLACHAASNQLWELVAGGAVEDGPPRGAWLAEQIRRIDPVVLDDPNGLWSFYVEELINEVI